MSPAKSTLSLLTCLGVPALALFPAVGGTVCEWGWPCIDAKGFMLPGAGLLDAERDVTGMVTLRCFIPSIGSAEPSDEAKGIDCVSDRIGVSCG